MEQKKYVIVKQSFKKAFLEDLMTFGFLLVTFALSEWYVGSTFLNGVLLIMLVLMGISWSRRQGKVFNSKDEAINYLKEEE